MRTVYLHQAVADSDGHQMRYTNLGSTDIKVSRMALGCWPFAGGTVWGPQDDAESISAVHAALDNGVNFFDTAEGYDDDSNSEDVLGRALVDRRSEAVIATKVSASNLRPQDVKTHCEASLRRLRTDYIDLYQIHWPNHDVPLADTMDALLRLQDDGKIRTIGVCNFGVVDLGESLGHGTVVTDQLPYNLLWRAIEFAIQPMCVDREVGLICYSPLAQGMLARRYADADAVPPGLARSRHFSSERELAIHGESGQESKTFAAIQAVNDIAESAGAHPATVSLAWVLSRPGVTSLLVGARNAREVEMNLPAFEYELTSNIASQLKNATEPLKSALGPNPDMWHSPGRMR